MNNWQPIETAPKDGTEITIRLTLGQITIIDKSDGPIVRGFSWQAHPRRDEKGFYAVNSNGVRMSRLLMGVSDGRIVDHIDGDGLNNRRSNLRIGSQSQNCVNRRTTPGPYLRGVARKGNKWRAQIKVGGKNKMLGYFESEEEAHVAYLRESHKQHGDWQPLPSPPEESK